MEEEREFFHGNLRRPGSWELQVILHSAIHIDIPLPGSMTTRPAYYVCARVEDSVTTTTKRYWLNWANVIWEEGFTMDVNSQPSEGSLYLELVRVGAPQDPGSSTGHAVVGRAVVPLITHKRMRVTLVKPLGGHGGDLVVSLNLRRRVLWTGFDFST